MTTVASMLTLVAVALVPANENAEAGGGPSVNWLSPSLNVIVTRRAGHVNLRHLRHGRVVRAVVDPPARRRRRRARPVSLSRRRGVPMGGL